MAVCQHDELETESHAKRVLHPNGKAMRVMLTMTAWCEECGASWGIRIGVPPHPTEGRVKAGE